MENTGVAEPFERKGLPPAMPAPKMAQNLWLPLSSRSASPWCHWTAQNAGAWRRTRLQDCVPPLRGVIARRELPYHSLSPPTTTRPPPHQATTTSSHAQNKVQRATAPSWRNMSGMSALPLALLLSPIDSGTKTPSLSTSKLERHGSRHAAVSRAGGGDVVVQCQASGVERSAAPWSGQSTSLLISSREGKVERSRSARPLGARLQPPLYSLLTT